MILNKKAFKNPRLRSYWESGYDDNSGLPPDLIKRVKIVLVHLDSARSLDDIAEGLGKLRNHHKLKGFECRYAMSVSGNYRITYDCEDSGTGVVTKIDFEDYH